MANEGYYSGNAGYDNRDPREGLPPPLAQDGGYEQQRGSHGYQGQGVSFVHLLSRSTDARLTTNVMALECNIQLSVPWPRSVIYTP
jgi:hypothetical protein